MEQSLKTTLIAAALCLFFGVLATVSVVEMWDQRTRRVAAKKEIARMQGQRNRDSIELRKVQEDLIKCQMQPRITVQAGKRNKVQNK